MDQLPALTGIFFVLTTALTVLIFHGASYFSKSVLHILIIWFSFQTIVSFIGFYSSNTLITRRLLVQAVPVILFAAILFNTSKGKHFIDNLDLPTLTLIHVIRIPLELVLFWLFFYQNHPGISIFETRNMDLLAGITAPVMMYGVFIKNRLSRNTLLTWNCISIALLLNTFISGILPAPLPYCYVDPEQPNMAVLYFPFLFMSCGVVPLVLLSHLMSIRLLVRPQSVTYIYSSETVRHL